MKKNRLSKWKQNTLIEHFVAGATARCADSLVGVNLKTSAYYFQRLHKLIADHPELEACRAFVEKLKLMSLFRRPSQKK